MYVKYFIYKQKRERNAMVEQFYIRAGSCILRWFIQ